MSIDFDPLNRAERRRREAVARRKKHPPQVYDPGASPFKGAITIPRPGFSRRRIWTK